MTDIKDKITMLHDRLLVEPEPVKTSSDAGMMFAQTADNAPVKGKVVAAGPGIPDIAMTVKESHQILYDKHAGTEIEIEGKKYLLMREMHVIAIIIQ